VGERDELKGQEEAMSTPAEEATIIGTFADAHVADLAADSARKAGFHVSRAPARRLEIGPEAPHARSIAAGPA
jgi:hypothetical protein